MARELKALDRQSVFYFNAALTSGQTIAEALGGTATDYPIFDASGHRRLVGMISSSQAPASGYPRIRFYDNPSSSATAYAVYVLDKDTTQSNNSYLIDVPLMSPFFSIEWTMGATGATVFGSAWVYPEDSSGTINFPPPPVNVQRPSTYRLTFNGLAAPIGQFLELRNPAASGRVIRVTMQLLSKPTTTMRWSVAKQSALSTGGTSSSPTICPMDSNNPTTVGVVKLYTVAPTAGALVANVWNIPSVTAGDTFVDQPGEAVNTQAIVLRAGESVAWTSDVTATVGGDIEFTESSA